MDALPDLTHLSDDELEALLRSSEDDEEAISVRRRQIHAKIDTLRHARVERLRESVEAGTLDLPAPETLERPIFEGTGDLPEERTGEAVREPASFSDDELRAAIIALEREEDDISLRRRMLHGRIDILRA